MESGAGPVSGNIRTIRSIEKALEDGGAGFIDDERKPGVCLREFETPV